MTPLELATYTIIASLAAAILHECTHAAVAYLAGRDNVSIDVRGLDAYWDLPPDGATLSDRLAFFSPILIGSIAAVLYIVVGFAVTIPGVVAWVVYTLNGIPGDLTINTVSSLSEDNAERQVEPPT